MEIKFVPTQEPEAKRKKGFTRINISICITADPEEAPFFKTPRYIQTAKPCPATIYQFSNPAIITKAANRTYQFGSNPKIPFGAFARSGLPINQWVSGSALNMGYPGTTDFGWIDIDAYEKVVAWLNTELPLLSERLQAIVNKEISATSGIAFKTISASAKSAPVTSPTPTLSRPKVTMGRGIFV